MKIISIDRVDVSRERIRGIIVVEIVGDCDWAIDQKKLIKNTKLEQLMFSIYILTYNEEIDIADCIESALLSDDVIVVDSLSSDRTVEIASHYPVRVVQHAFESHGKQRTWMLESIPTKHEWVYILEADERMTPELFAECLEAAGSDRAIGYYVAERVMFMGKWIRHSTQYPRYQMRLFQKDKVWFDDYGHTEREVCEGNTSFVKQTYPHYTSGKGLSRWLDKHNRYSTDEAKETIDQLKNGKVNWYDLFLGKSEIQRRRALKDLSLRLPCRPLLRWFYMYFILKGFLDGKAGFAWCTLQAFYEYIILLKVEEFQRLETLTQKKHPETTVNSISQASRSHLTEVSSRVRV